MFSQVSVNLFTAGWGVVVGIPGWIGIPGGRYKGVRYTQVYLGSGGGGCIPSPHLVVATKTRTVSKRAVRILLECCFVSI